MMMRRRVNKETPLFFISNKHGVNLWERISSSTRASFFPWRVKATRFRRNSFAPLFVVVRLDSCRCLLWYVLYRRDFCELWVYAFEDWHLSVFMSGASRCICVSPLLTLIFIMITYTYNWNNTDDDNEIYW